MKGDINMAMNVWGVIVMTCVSRGVLAASVKNLINSPVNTVEN
jgi:hypothetical protein